MLAAACACAPALAGEEVDPFALSPEQLFDATVVSVSRMPEKLGEAPAAVFVLTSEDIRRSGATSIPEALRLVPGVTVARGSNSGWAVSIRGFGNALTNKLLVLIDGRAVYDPLFSGVYWDVQDTPLEDIERIEVIRGPGASEWGANAVNGVISIITKRASDTQGLMMSATIGNRDLPVLSARYGGAAGKNAHFRIYGKYSNRPSSDTLASTGAEDQWKIWQGGFRVDWDQDPSGNDFTLQGDIYHSESGQFRSVPQLTPPYAVVNRESIIAEGENILGRWNRQLTEDSRFTVQMYFDAHLRDQLTLKDSRNTFDFDGQYELPALGWNKLTVGLGYRYTRDQLGLTSIIASTKTELKEELFSGFLTDKITLQPGRWFLTVGSKFEHNEFTGFEIEPTARLQWQGDNQQMAWASVSRAVRTPSELEHDLTVFTGTIPPGGSIPVPVAVDLTPSPDFKSEELVAYEIGYRREWTPSVMTDLTAFYNDYDRLSTLSLMAPQLVLTSPVHLILPLGSTNMTRANTYGFEASANWRVLENWNLSSAYGVLQMDLKGPPSNQAIASTIAENQSPQQQFNIRSQWDIDQNFSFDTTLYYVAPIRAYQVNAYWRLDARLGWRLSDQLQLELVGQNLLMARHREFNAPTDANATYIGRSVYGRIVWRQ